MLNRRDPGSEYSTPSLCANALQALCAAVKKLNGNPSRLTAGTGVESEDLARPFTRVSYRQSDLIVARAIAQWPDEPLSLHLTRPGRANAYGPLGLAMMSCATLHEAVMLGIRYPEHFGVTVKTDIEIRGDRFYLSFWQAFPEPRTMPFWAEASMACMVNLSRTLLAAPGAPQFVPLRVDLQHAAPPYAAAVFEALCCPVRFNAPRNLMVGEKRWLEMPLPTRNGYVKAEAIAHLDLAPRPRAGQRDLVVSIQGMLGRDPSRRLTVEYVAADLNMASRTLRRHLLAQGTCFRDLCSEARCELALRLLERNDCSVSTAAASVGFADTRSFRRAFKRWTGQTPGNFDPGLAPDASAASPTPPRPTAASRSPSTASRIPVRSRR